MNIGYFAGGVLIWGVILGLAYFIVSPSSCFYSVKVKECNKKHIYITYGIVTALTAVCILPMGINPIWNGENPEHRNQYELTAEALLGGHFYIDYQVDPKLLEMNNPYDPAERDSLGVVYHWDHAFYNGHYYMYFGIVPVFLLFLPFRILTGGALTTYHATQIFTALFIIGMFRLLYAMAKKFFDELPMGLYWIMCTAFSIISVWFCIGSPALYCTAITSGMCLGIWSLYFFFKAVYGEYTVNRKIAYAFLGALFGAAVFGCRPTVGIVNLLVIPMLVTFIKDNKLSVKLFGKLAIAASPYLVIGALLMIYNYVRFDSPFEFGQAYQLTVADQSVYQNVKLTDDIARVFNILFHNFFDIGELGRTFPHVSPGGIIFNFSILVMPLTIFFNGKVLAGIKHNKLVGITVWMFIVPVIISVVTGVWTPFLIERYHMDIYWIMGIFSFIVIGLYYSASGGNRIVARIFGMWALLMILKSILFCLYPDEANYFTIHPELLDKIGSMVRFGL